jgi:putative tryptophan/tyrosine transport system substrate-binding protein
MSLVGHNQSTQSSATMSAPLLILLRRREFIAGLGGVAAWPVCGSAQQSKKLSTIGILTIGTQASSGRPGLPVDSFVRGLRELGWIEGENIRVELAAAPRVELLPELAAELVRMQVDVIFASSSTFVEAALRATKTIPIVFSAHNDPIGVGHVASLAHPGGNVTGLSQLQTELVTKELELLAQAIPQAKRIGVLWNPTTPSNVPALKAVETAAEQLGVALQVSSARSADELDVALSTLAQAHVQALLVVSSPLSGNEAALLAHLALRYRLPSMFQPRVNVEAGGLMSYGPDIPDLYRRAAVYVDKILKGAKPADLPVEQASKYQLLINLKTAKALGLTIPETLLATADEVIQ